MDEIITAVVNTPATVEQKPMEVAKVRKPRKLKAA